MQDEKPIPGKVENLPTGRWVTDKRKITLNSAYKFYVEGEMSEGDFKNILKERGYTVIIEGASRYKYGMLKGVVISVVAFIILLITMYFIYIIFGVRV
jgi:hypothetical protein